MRWMFAVLQSLGPAPLLKQPLRRRLMSLIRGTPGIHASEICRETGEAWGTVQYHLRLLQESQMVTSVEAGRARRFFPEGIDAQKQNLVMLLHETRREQIARLIQERPGIRQVDICREAALSRKTFRSKVGPLIDAGLVAEHKGLQTARYFPEEGLAPLLEPGMDVV